MSNKYPWDHPNFEEGNDYIKGELGHGLTSLHSDGAPASIHDLYRDPSKAIQPAAPAKIDLELIEEGAKLILMGLGVDLTSHNFASTPARVAKVYQELFTPEETGWPVFAEDYTDIVIVAGHVFWTMCPHHLLPVRIEASVAYYPNGQVVGYSKLMRLIHEVNRKPETQEKLTDMISESIKRHTNNTSLGEAVFLVGEHGCSRMRGLKSEGVMKTYKFTGVFKDNLEHQSRFLELVR